MINGCTGSRKIERREDGEEREDVRGEREMKKERRDERGEEREKRRDEILEEE